MNKYQMDKKGIIGLTFSILAVIASLKNLGGWKYPLATNPDYFHVPLLDFLEGTPHGLNLSIHLVAMTCAIAAVIGWKRAPMLIFIGFVQLYSLFVDYFSFHHDVFLSFLMFSSVGLYLTKYGQLGLVLAKIVIILAYTFAGLNKASWEFLTGDMVETLLNQSPYFSQLTSPFGAFKSTIAWSAMILELLLPLFLLLFSGRILLFVMIPGLFFHLGILTTGTGTLFNLLFPAAYLLWLSYDFETFVSNDGSNLTISYPSLTLVLASLPFFGLAMLASLAYATEFGYLIP